MQMMDVLLRRYFEQNDLRREAVPFGLTNHSEFVYADGRKFVARLYDPFSKTKDKLHYEIELTSFLKDAGLPFEVPGFMTSQSGDDFVELPDGHLGAVMTFIEGEVPDLSRGSDVKSYGETVGLLSSALAKFTRQPPQSVRFDRPFLLHPLGSEEAVRRFIDEPPFEVKLERLKAFGRALESLTDQAIELAGLPVQTIPHDLLIFNLLIDRPTRRMTGVLDFDLSAPDLRAFEPAVCLNHLLQFGDGSLDAAADFSEAYFRHATLTEAEIEQIPMLMELYYMALLCFYIGQHQSGKSVVDPFRFILDQWLRRKDWLLRESGRLTDLLFRSAKAGEQAE